MADAVPRVQFDFDLDDLADVSVRYFRASKTGRAMRRLAMCSAGGGVIVAAVLVVWLSGVRDMTVIGTTAAVALPLAILVGRNHGPIDDESRRRTIRRALAEEYGDEVESRRFLCEVELRADGLWVGQNVSRQRLELLHAWPDMIAATAASDGLEFRFRGGYVIVRNRAFATEADRAGFLERAHSLARAAQ